MVDGNNHPFNNDAIAVDLIIQYENHLSNIYNGNIEKHYYHKDLMDILYWNNINGQSLYSHDSTFSVTLHSVSDDDFNRLKYLIRSIIWPLDDHIREQLWMNILTVNRFSSIKENRPRRRTSQTALTTLSVITENSLNSFSSRYNQWAKFVDKINLCFYYLIQPIGCSLLQRILLTFALHHSDITYSPSIQPFAALLLHYHNENQVLYLLNILFNKNWLCGKTHLQWQANCNVFQKLLKLYYVYLIILTNKKIFLFLLFI